MQIMAWVWTLSIALLGYTYAGYPALIWLLARVRGRGVEKGPYAGGAAVLIAAHDEAESLPRKLENLLELAKSEPIREIWIGLDGCTDGTGERVREKIRISNVQEERIQNSERMPTSEMLPNSDFCILAPKTGYRPQPHGRARMLRAADGDPSTSLRGAKAPSLPRRCGACTSPLLEPGCPHPGM